MGVGHMCICTCVFVARVNRRRQILDDAGTLSWFDFVFQEEELQAQECHRSHDVFKTLVH